MQIKINEQLKEIEALKEKNILTRVRQFCSKSEHNKDNNEFNEAESNVQKKEKRGRKEGSKNFDYEYLEKHVSKEIILESKKEVCSICGETLISIGEDITYK